MLNFADKITPNPMDSKLQSEFLHLFNTMGIEEGFPVSQNYGNHPI